MTTLLDSQSVTLDAAGFGQVRVQVRGGKSWSVEGMATSCTGGQGITLKVFRNQATDNNLIDTSSTGELDASDTAFTLNQGETLVATYQGTAADVGARATLTVSGTINR